MAVYDCFMFNNELDVLELRLTELEDVVDRFVLVEAAEAHSGLPKPLHFEANRNRFARWLDRIVHVRLDRLPPSDDAWVKENAQREAIRQGLPEIGDDDLVIVSDADEIPRARTIRRLLEGPAPEIAGLRLGHFYIRLNYLQVRGLDSTYVWPMAARGAAFRRYGPQGLRDLRIDLQRGARLGTLPDGMDVIEHAGWHFSYLGDDDHVRRKLASFAHRELAASETLETHGIDGILAQRLDLFGRPGFGWSVVAINRYFPEAVWRNSARYRPLFAKWPELVIDLPQTYAGRGIKLRPYPPSGGRAPQAPA